MKTLDRVTTLKRLNDLIRERRSLYCPSSHSFKLPKPAAFFINLPGFQIADLFDSGLYVYEKPSKPKE